MPRSPRPTPRGSTRSGSGKSKPRTSRESSLKQRVREERRSVYLEAVTEAAEKIFAEKGADASRMNDIAAEAGISLGTLYGVIEGKADLLLGIHKRRMQAFLDCIRAASAGREETLARHLAVLRLGAQYFLDHPDFLRMCCQPGLGWASRFPAPGAAADVWDEGTAVPRELFVLGIEEGLYVDEDPDLLVRKMLALKQVELSHWVEHGMRTPHEEVLDRLESQFLRAFCLPHGGA